MKLIKNIILIIFFFLVVKAKGQTDYSQYYINLPSINSGLTGIDDYLNLVTGFRQGLNDFSDNNSSVFISAYGTLNKPLRHMINNNALRISDPKMLDRIRNSKKLRRKHGIGGSLSNRTLGPSNSSAITLNYAYHLPISKKFNWSMGAAVMYNNEQISFEDFVVRDPVNDLFYQELMKNNSGNRSILNVDFGTAIYSNDFYFGISSQNLIQSEINNTNNLSDLSISRVSVITGKEFDLSPNIDLSLSAISYMATGYDVNWAGNVRLKYKSLAYFGFGYENEKRVSLLVGVLAAKKIALHYSYDNYISELSNFNLNSHEVMLGIQLFNRFNVPVKYW